MSGAQRRGKCGWSRMLDMRVGWGPVAATSLPSLIILLPSLEMEWAQGQASSRMCGWFQELTTATRSRILHPTDAVFSLSD